MYHLIASWLSWLSGIVGEKMEILLGPIIALLTVAISAWVSYLIAKRQISASTVTTGRQAWINNFRDILSKFLAKCGIIATQARVCVREDTVKHIYDLTELTNRIELMINPQEEDHIKLVSLVNDIGYYLSQLLNKDGIKETDLNKTFREKRLKVVELAQKILKSEWERVKKGEPSKLWIWIKILVK